MVAIIDLLLTPMSTVHTSPIELMCPENVTDLWNFVAIYSVEAEILRYLILPVMVAIFDLTLTPMSKCSY